MRICVIRRILAIGIALALLCALPAVTPSTSFAKHIGLQGGPDPDDPGPTKGDGDGTVVKAHWIGGTTYEATRQSTVSVSSRGTWSVWRTYLSLVRWGFATRLTW